MDERFPADFFQFPHSVPASGNTQLKHLFLGPHASTDSSTEHNPIEKPWASYLLSCPLVLRNVWLHATQKGENVLLHPVTFSHPHLAESFRMLLALHVYKHWGDQVPVLQVLSHCILQWPKASFQLTASQPRTSIQKIWCLSLKDSQSLKTSIFRYLEISAIWLDKWLVLFSIAPDVGNTTTYPMLWIILLHWALVQISILLSSRLEVSDRDS